MKLTVTSSRARTNRKLSLLGACGLLALTVIQLPKVADHWRELQSHAERRAEMLDGLTDYKRSDQLDEQLQEVDRQLSSCERSMVGVDMMPAIQSELMELARDSGCQLRKAVIQAGSSETWEIEKSEQELIKEQDEGIAGGESPYSLSTQQLSLNLTGSLEQTFDFLDRVQKRSWLQHVAQINFSRDPDADGQLIVEANLAFYKLEKKTATGDETVQWREGSRAGQLQ